MTPKEKAQAGTRKANPPGERWTIEAELDGETFSKTADIGSRFYVTFDFKFKSAKPN